MSNKKFHDTEIFIAALKAVMAKYGLNQPQLTKKTGIPSGSISAYLNGNTDPGFTQIKKIATALGMTVSQFFALGEGIEPPRLAILPEGEIEPEGFLRVPLTDDEDFRLAAGTGGFIPTTYEAARSPVVVHGPSLGRRSNHMLQAYRVGGDSMEPIIAEGGLVIADLAQTEPPGRGRAIFVLCWDLTEGEYAVKHLSWYRKGEEILIESENRKGKTDNPPQNKAVDEIKIIGRVIWAWRSF